MSMLWESKTATNQTVKERACQYLHVSVMNHQDENKEVVQEQKRNKRRKQREGRTGRHYGMFGKRGQICAQKTETMANFMKRRVEKNTFQCCKTVLMLNYTCFDKEEAWGERMRDCKSSVRKKGMECSSQKITAASYGKLTGSRWITSAL